MGEQFFDDLARGLDEGTISRRRALRLVGGAAFGAALMPVMPKQAEALTRRFRRRCRRKGGSPLEKGNCHCAAKCNSDFSRFHCNGSTNCTCLRTLSGKGFCAQGTLFEFSGCPTQTSCPSGTKCVVFFGCEGGGQSCTRATATTDCPSSFGCVNGTCQLTTCLSPCPPPS